MASVYRWLVELLQLCDPARADAGPIGLDPAAHAQVFLAALAQSCGSAQCVYPSRGARPSPRRGWKPPRCLADGTACRGPSGAQDEDAESLWAWIALGTRGLSPLDSTAGCGKPLVRWCGRGDGRYSVTPTRFPQVSDQSRADSRDIAFEICSHRCRETENSNLRIYARTCRVKHRANRVLIPACAGMTVLQVPLSRRQVRSQGQRLLELQTAHLEPDLETSPLGAAGLGRKAMLERLLLPFKPVDDSVQPGAQRFLFACPRRELRKKAGDQILHLSRLPVCRSLPG